MKQKKIKILFNGHDFKFLTYVIDFFKNSDDYEVLLDNNKGHVIEDKETSQNLLNKSNIIFCEWCLGNAEWYSQNKRKDQILIIRLHHQEIGLDYLYRTNWDNVDKIILICQNNMRLFLEKFPLLRNKSVLIYNLIDCNTLNKAKLPGAEFNLGFIGISPKRKAPHLAIEILSKLRRIDKRYTLFIKGKMPQEYHWLWSRKDEKEYFLNLFTEIDGSEIVNSVVFDPQGKDMPNWFSKIGFLLSTSDHEGSHQAVAEAMAAGSIPVIRNWDGADQIYPARFVFKSVDQAVELVQKWKTIELYKPTVDSVQEYAMENFDKSGILRKYEEMIHDLITQNKYFISFSQHIIRKPVMIACFLSPEKQSGYETRVIEEAKTLNNFGVDVIIAAFYSGEEKFSDKTLNNFVKRVKSTSKANVYIFPVHKFFNLSFPVSTKKSIHNALSFLIQKYQISVIHCEALYTAVHVLRANKKLRVKVVFDDHGITPEETQMSGGSEERIDKLEELEADTLNKANHRIYVSNAMRNFYEKKYDLPELVNTILPCCVHSKQFLLSQQKRQHKRKELGIDNKFVIVYLGTLSVWQWPDAIFSLFSHLYKKDPQSLLYLLIPEYDHDKASHYIKLNNLPKESYIIEEVPHNKVGDILGVADVGLLLRKKHPVNYVSSPTKFGEYLAAGVPVILTEEIGDYSELTRNNNIGIVIKVSDNGINRSESKKLTLFVEDIKKNRNKWSKQCYSFAENDLDWLVYGENLKRMYENLF